ncbi:MAG: ribonuclease R [Firmicutes bacterium]|nr:ribonuclease R [Bacillota bacterium]
MKYTKKQKNALSKSKKAASAKQKGGAKGSVVTGVLEVKRKGFGFLKTGVGEDIFISANALNGAADGDTVEAVMLRGQRGERAGAEVKKILEHRSIASIIRAHGLPEKFPAAVLKEAQRVAVAVSAEEKLLRRDFCAETVFTIDGADAKDFDDAVSLRVNENGNYLLGVHIADVSHYVAHRSVLDSEAFKRGTSAYFADRVLPMLPESLSNGICSLVEGEERLTVSALMEISPNGELIAREFCPSVIKSCARLTYAEVAGMLDGTIGTRAELLPVLQSMRTLAEILHRKRKQRGNIDFDLPEAELILNRDGRCTDVRRRPRYISHKMIEEFMLAANEAAAEFMYKAAAPFIYRVHEEPPQEKAEDFIAFLSGLGIAFSGDSEKPQPRDFAELLRSVAGGKLEAAVSRTALRTMSKACYMPVNKGHFGLAAQYYCHFTSPIRRYPDLVIHRIMKDFLAVGKECFTKYKAFAAAAANESSERERVAERAERDAEEFKKAEFMASQIGVRYDGIISGVTQRGVFVELPNTCEGMIRVENLPGTGYDFNERQMRLYNKAYSFRIGDPVTVEVASVLGLKAEFSLVT